jgi:hypothetical protein
VIGLRRILGVGGPVIDSCKNILEYAQLILTRTWVQIVLR